MNVTDEMVEAAARADAEHAGRRFEGLSKADRVRFLERSRSMLSAALSTVEKVETPAQVPSPQTLLRVPIAYIAPEIFERLKAGGSGMFPISNSEFKNSDLTVPLYAELPEFQGEETPEGGVVRLSKWPEGYVLWYHGEIVWRSWIKTPQEMTLRLSLDTTALREALTQAQEQETPDRVCQEADGCPTEKSVLQRFWREHHNTAPQSRVEATSE